jgi:hypothetical protein
MSGKVKILLTLTWIINIVMTTSCMNRDDEREILITGYGKHIKIISNNLTLEIDDKFGKVDKIFTVGGYKISMINNVINSDGPVFVEYGGGEQIGIDNFDGKYAINQNGVDYPNDRQIFYSIDNKCELTVLELNNKKVD